MCYHVSRPSVRALKNEYKDGFHVDEASERFGAYEHPNLPVTFTPVRDDFRAIEWPLIPHWAKDLAHARKLQASGYNARAETMFEKPMFRDAARNSRCIIWLDGFYEWQHVGKKRIQYFIHMPHKEPFPVGGLYSRWRNPADGELFHTCAIVMTEANGLLSEIHNTKKRMPLILSDETRGIWLSHALPRQAIEEICKPFPDGLLIAELVKDGGE